MAIDEDDRKAKVLHARIPEALEEELKTKAGRLGISVSNLVRNALMHAFGLVDDVVADSAEIARSARGGPSREAPRAAAAAPDNAVLGWQPAVLNLNAVCEKCNAILRKGTSAAIGIRALPGPVTALCADCLKEITDESQRNDPR
jgi:hypothetical protein